MYDKLQMGQTGVRIGIVDDHPLFRMGLRQALDRVAGIEVVWDVGHTRDLQRLTERKPVDAILMDVNLGGGAEGVAAAQTIIRRQPAMRVIMISATVDNHLIFAARRAGAVGYLAKDLDPDALVSSIQVLAAPRRGWRASSHDLMQALAEGKGRRGTGRTSGGGSQMLSPRELEVLNEIRLGRTNVEIAGRLGISLTTVNKHVHQILRKLNARNRAQAATLFGQVAGLIAR